MRIDHFEKDRGVGISIIGTHSIEELCPSLALPRWVKSMEKAGAAVIHVFRPSVTPPATEAPLSPGIRFNPFLMISSG